jgi:hypothetical protein
MTLPFAPHHACVNKRARQQEHKQDVDDEPQPAADFVMRGVAPIVATLTPGAGDPIHAPAEHRFDAFRADEIAQFG